MLGDGSSNGVDVERFSPGTSDVRERWAFQGMRRWWALWAG